MADFSALHVALSGLRAAQASMDTASHNVSNANTVGYTRQRVDLAARYPRITAVGQLGMGVAITDITRIRDEFLDVRFRSNVSLLNNAQARSELLSRAERVLSEPDLGVSAELSRLWDSWEDLALNPSDPGSRVAVIEQLSAVASRITDVAGGLDRLRLDGVAAIESTLTETNQILQQVADLNVAILDTATSGSSPNDLMDQRDLLLDRLSELVGANSTIEDNGGVRVSLGGVSLVSGSLVRGLSFDSATGQIIHASGVTVVAGGEARGLQLAVTTDLPDKLTLLDAFAVDLVDALNSLHATGFTSAGVAGGPLLSYGSPSAALSLSVAISSPVDLAGAATAGPPYPTHDATVFEGLAGLRTSLAAAGGTQTLADSFRTLVSALGQEASSARVAAENQGGLLSAAGVARDSAHGVSIDEEMVHLIEFQRMYEAAARVVTAVDQALDTVINRMGAVGR